MIAENTAKPYGGRYYTVTLEEVLHPTPPDTRSGAEIAADIIKRIGGEPD